MSELLNCPFCGEEPTEFSQSNKDREGTPVAVACSGCGALGPWVYCPEMKGGSLNKAEAINEWNQRQPHPDSALLEFTFKHKIAYVKHPKDNWSLILDGESIYGGETPREAIQQAMEQEK